MLNHEITEPLVDTFIKHPEAACRLAQCVRPFIQLSDPALETLTVIALFEPVTITEIENIRGVNCGGVVRGLIEKQLIAASGRKKVAGHPVLYRTQAQRIRDRQRAGRRNSEGL